MKIAFLNYQQKGAGRGLETFIDQLSQGLSKNHTVKVLSGPGSAKAGITSIPLHRRLFLDKVSLQVAAWTFKILSDLNRFNPDIVFTQNGGWQTLIIRFWTLLKGKKMVISAQSGPGWDDRWNLLWHPDLFVALTKAQTKWARNVFHWPGQKVATIGNGVDIKKFALKGSRVQLKLEKPIIISVAALEKGKRVEETIHAVAKLKKGSLLLLGDGPLKKAVNDLGKKLLGENRFLNTTVPHSAIAKYYRSADLFSLCSATSEAFGIVYLEAMASGLPVVATNDPIRQEIVDGAGILVTNPQNIDEYAQAIDTLLHNPSKTSPQKQASKYSWSTIATAYETVLKSLQV